MSDSNVLSPFLTRFDAKAKRPDVPPEPIGDDDEVIAPGDAYAAVTGQRIALAIEFIPRDGDAFVIHYADILVLWIRQPDTLLIEYRNLFTVGLRVKGFDSFKRLLRDQRITRITECSEAEAAGLEVAITRIDILRIYPSREAGIDPNGGTP